VSEAPAGAGSSSRREELPSQVQSSGAQRWPKAQARLAPRGTAVDVAKSSGAVARGAQAGSASPAVGRERFAAVGVCADAAGSAGPRQIGVGGAGVLERAKPVRRSGTRRRRREHRRAAHGRRPVAPRTNLTPPSPRGAATPKSGWRLGRSCEPGVEPQPALVIRSPALSSVHRGTAANCAGRSWLDAEVCAGAGGSSASAPATYETASSSSSAGRGSGRQLDRGGRRFRRAWPPWGRRARFTGSGCAARPSKSARVRPSSGAPRRVAEQLDPPSTREYARRRFVVARPGNRPRRRLPPAPGRK